ncbi:hypothetical protein BGY98DRAFT_39302 [Russula aff. rugulosa BPL654]|nr:hypothetical protein BGY98DRAFT_39302 [Russula aff. rugulosa BPL654]
MGNLCGSAATVPSEPQSGPPVAELRPSTPDSLQLGPNVKEESSVPSSSRSLSRPRCHSSASQRLSTQQSGRSSQDPTPRSRTKSAPHPPQTFKPSSPQDPRSRLVVQSKSSRSDPRPTSPEHAKLGVRSPTMSYPSRRALNSTVKQVLAENPQYVARFLVPKLHSS